MEDEVRAILIQAVYDCCQNNGDNSSREEVARTLDEDPVERDIIMQIVAEVIRLARL